MKSYSRSRGQMIKRMRGLGLIPLVLAVLCSLPEQAAAVRGVLEEGQTVVTPEDYFCPDPHLASTQSEYLGNIDGDYLYVYFKSAASGYTPYMSPTHAHKTIRRTDLTAYPNFYRIRFDAMGGDPQPTNQQDVVEGRTGPGYIGVDWDYRHRLVFWVDFNRTPTDPNDDQRFDGYITTQTESAIAGITWKKGIPVSFRITAGHC